MTCSDATVTRRVPLIVWRSALLNERPFNSGGPVFRAYDKRTGAVIWEFTLPGNQTSAPIDIHGGRKAAHRGNGGLGGS